MNLGDIYAHLMNDTYKAHNLLSLTEIIIYLTSIIYKVHNLLHHRDTN